MAKGWIVDLDRRTVTTGSMATPIGRIRVFTDQDVVLAIEFEDQGRAAAILERQLGRIDFTGSLIPRRVAAALNCYFETARCDAFSDLRLRPNGTEFQRGVWQQLLRIPPGTTVSYGEVARSLEMPNASRAVGLANGSNPIPIIIPCHRVIGASGKLTGYGSGIERKAWLLRHEGAVSGQRPL